MHEYTRLKEDADEHDIGLLLVADAEIFRLEAMVRWLDAADARIKRLPTPVYATAPTTAADGPPAARSEPADDRHARDLQRVEVVRRRCGRGATR